MQSAHGHQRQILAVPACFKVKMAQLSVREKRFSAYEKRGLVRRKWRGEFFTKRRKRKMRSGNPDGLLNARLQDVYLVFLFIFEKQLSQ
jgi:hypothetical protein